MPRIRSETLQSIQAAIYALGALCTVAVAAWIARRGRWRDPLATPPAPRGPGIAALPLVIAIHMLASPLLAQACGVSANDLATPGSHRWHIAMCVDAAARLLTAGVALLVLRPRSTPRETTPPSLRPQPHGHEPRRASLGLQAAVVLVTALILQPLCYSQLYLSNSIWQALNPGATPPEHAVLQAIEHSAWGPWGAVQLVALAVVFAPLVEELLFRGVLLQSVWAATGLPWLAITLSSVTFGLVHLPQPQNVLPLTSMGVLLGVVRARFGSLPACIAIHAIFNLQTIIFALLNPEFARFGG